MNGTNGDHELKHLKWASITVLITCGIVGAMWGWAFTAIDRQSTRLNSVDSRLVRIETIVEMTASKIDMIVAQRREEARTGR